MTILKSNLPICLTLGRLLAPLVICPLIFMDRSGLAALIFALAALTDWLDGMLARRWGIVSEWGRILDPVADKMLVLLTLLALIAAADFGLSVVTLTFLLFFREILVSGLREQGREPIAVKTASKAKTVFQILAILGLMIGGGMAPSIPFMATCLLAIAVALGLYTAILYAREAIR